MTFINGLIALVGAFTLILSKKTLNKITLLLVAFATGSLLGGAIFHFIPEAIEELSLQLTGLLILSGIILFYFLEKILHWHHCHKTGVCERHPYTDLILYGDSIHNFIDGLIIAASFLISIPFGIITSILIMLHEFPQEIGDFAVLIHGGFTNSKALLYNFLSQLTAVLGGILGYYYLSLRDYSIYLLPFAAGGFLYIAIGDLIPEILKEKDLKKRLINLLALIIGFLILVSAKILTE